MVGIGRWIDGLGNGRWIDGLMGLECADAHDSSYGVQADGEYKDCAKPRLTRRSTPTPSIHQSIHPKPNTNPIIPAYSSYL